MQVEQKGRPKNPDTAVFIHLLNGLEIGESFKWKDTTFGKVWGLIVQHQQTDRKYSVKTIQGIKWIFRIQ